MRTYREWLALALIAGAPMLLTACSDDDGDDDPGTMEAGGGADDDDAGAGDTDTDEGTTPTPPPPPVTCGGTDCEGVTTPLGDLTPCCAGEGEASCGLDTSALAAVGLPAGCIEKDQPGEPGCFPSAIEVPGVGGLDLEGCCRPDDTCGTVLNDVAGVVTLGLGCVSPVDLGVTEAPADSGIPPEAGWPVSCEVGNMIAAGGGGADSDGGTDSDAGDDSDAGGDDTGGDDTGGDDTGGEAELTKTCSEAYTCATGCGGDDVCAAACGEGTDAESGALLAAIGTCLGTACPVDPATQMQDLFGCVVPAVGDGGACEGAIDACNADAP